MLRHPTKLLTTAHKCHFFEGFSLITYYRDEIGLNFQHQSCREFYCAYLSAIHGREKSKSDESRRKQYKFQFRRSEVGIYGCRLFYRPRHLRSKKLNLLLLFILKMYWNFKFFSKCYRLLIMFIIILKLLKISNKNFNSSILIFFIYLFLFTFFLF